MTRTTFERAWRIPGGGLLHPIALVALVVLVVNDHLLKRACPGVLTGKLSDVAGLALFPLVLEAAWETLRRRAPDVRTSVARLRGFAVLTAIAFSAIKLVPAAADVYVEALGRLQWALLSTLAFVLAEPGPRIGRASFTPDATDLVALLALVVPFVVSRHRFGVRLRLPARGVRLAMLGAFALVATACGGPPKQGPRPENQAPSLGELVFRIVRQNLGTSNDCPAAYVTTLDTHHTDFVTTFDYAIAENVANSAPELLGGTILPVVEDGSLPNLVHTGADALALLVSDTFDPNRTTLGSFVRLANARTLLERSMAFDLASALLADPALATEVHSLALLGNEYDGVTYVADDLVSAGASLLEGNAPSQCSGIALHDVQGTILKTSGFVDDPAYALGAPKYMVRPDANGNPRVLRDAATGRLPPPFVDANLDGVADVNARGEPIDASGTVIEVRALGTDGSRDAVGRALNPHGGLLFDYYDVKRSALSFLLQLGADALAADVHHDVAQIATAVLPSPTTCTDGTTTCRAYSGTNNAVADLVFLGFEAMKFDEALELLDVVRELLATNPAAADDLLVAVGDVVTAFDASSLTLADTSLLDTGIGLLPIVDGVFHRNNTTGKSTPRLLVDVLHDMGATKHEIPADLRTVLGSTALAGQPATVDYTRPRFYLSGTTWVDNRSALEELIELFAYADSGYIGPVGGLLDIRRLAYGAITLIVPGVQPGTVAEVLVDAMSRLDPGTVHVLIDLIDGLNGLLPGGVELVLRSVGCSSHDAQAISKHLPALTRLAQVGGLDWLLPIARVFADQHQLRTLVDIFDYLATDLSKDGTYDAMSATSSSVVRRLEAPLDASIRTGAVDRILDVVDLLYTLPARTNGDDAVDLLVDSLAHVVAVGTVNTRNGAVANTSIGVELLKTVTSMVTKLDTTNRYGAFSHLLHFGTGYLTRTTGTGSSRSLANKNLRVLVATLLDTVHDAASLTPAQYACYVNEWQATSVNAMKGRTFATLVRLLAQFSRSTNGAAIESWAVTAFLRGNPAHPEREANGALLQIAAGALSSKATGDDLANVARWLGGVGAAKPTSIRDLVNTLDALLRSDQEGAILQIARNLVTAGPIASHDAPISTFASTVSDVASVDASQMCASSDALTVPRLESTVRGVVDFLNDDANGIGAVWRLVGAIAPQEPVATTP